MIISKIVSQNFSKYNRLGFSQLRKLGTNNKGLYLNSPLTLKIAQRLLSNHTPQIPQIHKPVQNILHPITPKNPTTILKTIGKIFLTTIALGLGAVGFLIGKDALRQYRCNRIEERLKEAIESTLKIVEKQGALRTQALRHISYHFPDILPGITFEVVPKDREEEIFELSSKYEQIQEANKTTTDPHNRKFVTCYSYKHTNDQVYMILAYGKESLYKDIEDLCLSQYNK